MRTWNRYTTVTRMVIDHDQDGHVVGAHEEPVNPDSTDKPVPARRVDRLLATRSLPAPQIGGCVGAWKQRWWGRWSQTARSC